MRISDWSSDVCSSDLMGSLSDPVLVRSDGYPLYTLSSVVDDGDLGITHIIRGEDHITNTAAQIQIFAALGDAAPVFGHFSWLRDAAEIGRALSRERVCPYV